MNNGVINYYENYKEENRITTNNARRIEFLTTVNQFEKIFTHNLKILDCAAGTGVYTFYLADKGHELTATDITPRHIDYINKCLKSKPYSVETHVLDATDMSCFADASFDVVLNMGPFYHLTKENLRKKCFEESLRVLKQGGYLVTAYIPRMFLNQMLVMSDEKYIDERFLTQIRDTGILTQDDPKCFWTDTYYSSYEEMQELYKKYGLEIISHFAQDGLAPLFHNTVDSWNENQFNTWFKYHLSVCSQKSIIDMSNHVIIIGKKKQNDYANGLRSVL